MSIIKSFVKSVNEVATWTIDWDDDIEDFLGSDTINTSSWSVSPSGLTIDSNTNTPTTASVTVSGGTLNTAYTLTNQITTVAGNTWEAQIVGYVGTETATTNEYFTYDLATDVGAVRFWLQDTVAARAIFSDAEINFVLTENASVDDAIKQSTIDLLVLKLAQFENPEYVADWLEERELREAAQTLQDRLKLLRETWGISRYTAVAKRIYRADSDQTAEPDFSDGADDASFSDVT